MAKQPVGALYVAYARAVNRFMTGGDRPRPLVERAVRHSQDPTSATDPFEGLVPVSAHYEALAEALNWAYTLDDRLRQDLGHAWVDTSTHRALAATVPAIRYARNCVQHQWNEAIVIDGGETRGRVRRGSVLVRWAPDLSASRRDPAGRAAYDSRLANRAVLPTLAELLPVFAQATFRGSPPEG